MAGAAVGRDKGGRCRTGGSDSGLDEIRSQIPEARMQNDGCEKGGKGWSRRCCRSRSDDCYETRAGRCYGCWDKGCIEGWGSPNGRGDGRAEASQSAKCKVQNDGGGRNSRKEKNLQRQVKRQRPKAKTGDEERWTKNDARCTNERAMLRFGVVVPLILVTRGRLRVTSYE